jgi:hypothetical protein
MAFRFRKSIKLLPGVRLNLSKSGVSASIGRPGATLNISENGTKGTVGLPGTGASYSEHLSGPAPGEGNDGLSRGVMLGLGLLVLIVWLLL